LQSEQWLRRRNMWRHHTQAARGEPHLASSSPKGRFSPCTTPCTFEGPEAPSTSKFGRKASGSDGLRLPPPLSWLMDRWQEAISRSPPNTTNNKPPKHPNQQTFLRSKLLAKAKASLSVFLTIRRLRARPGPDEKLWTLMRSCGPTSTTRERAKGIFVRGDGSHETADCGRGPNARVP
jgi:hypothetical protein